MNIRDGDLGLLFIRPFLVLCWPNSVEDAKPHSLRGAQTKKKDRNVQLGGNRELLLLAAPLGRTGWMEQGRATGPGVATTAGKRGGHMHCVSS